MPLVILTTHLKDNYINDKKTGSQIPDAKKTLNQKSNFRVWLRHNSDSPQPIGLVLKRPVKLTVAANGIEPINILPRKMKPCTWERIVNFWNNPIGNRPLTEDEKPDEFELSILDGTLTRDQKNILRLAVLEAEQEAQQPELVEPSNDDKLAQAKTMLEGGQSAKDVAGELGLKISDLARAGLL